MISFADKTSAAFKDGFVTCSLTRRGLTERLESIAESLGSRKEIDGNRAESGNGGARITTLGDGRGGFRRNQTVLHLFPNRGCEIEAECQRLRYPSETRDWGEHEYADRLFQYVG